MILKDMKYSNVFVTIYFMVILMTNAFRKVQATENVLEVIYAVNAGGYDHTDKNGVHYLTDPLHNKIGTASDYGNHLLMIGRVPEQDEVLYRTERYHTANFGYNVPFDGDGDYALIMKFCEVYFNEPNKKVFNVVLNGQHVIVTDLDIFHQVGRGTAHEEYAFFTIRNGRLLYKDEESPLRNGFVRLDFIKGEYDNPKINAFVLMKGDVESIPRLEDLSGDILSPEADNVIIHDRVSADNVVDDEDDAILDEEDEVFTETNPIINENEPQQQEYKNDLFPDEGEPIVEKIQRTRKTSGPRHPSPYTMDDSSVMLPVFMAIGAFIPLLFCLCKL